MRAGTAQLLWGGFSTPDELQPAQICFLLWKQDSHRRNGGVESLPQATATLGAPHSPLRTCPKMPWRDRRMCCVPGLVMAGQQLGGCPLLGLCLPQQCPHCGVCCWEPCSPSTSLWWEVLLLCFFPLCFVRYDKSD